LFRRITLSLSSTTRNQAVISIESNLTLRDNPAKFFRAKFLREVEGAQVASGRSRALLQIYNETGARIEPFCKHASLN
jgi:hypothetical protein